MIAVDMLAVLAVMLGLGLILAGLAVAWDRCQYALAAWDERRRSLARSRRHHPATRERVW